MIVKRNSNKKTSKKDNKDDNTDQNMSDEYSSDINAETTVRKYQDDKDYDEAFKNLLHPIESITKKSHCEPLQYNLLKELDSYLNHLKGTSDNGSLVFVEAALMIQNVILIYQKRVDQFIDVMMNLVAKFRAYRRNLNDNTGDEIEIEEGNKKKKKEKKVKLFPSFVQIKLGLNGPFKTFDCKLIDISKKPGAPKIVLNANIKVDNMYSKLLPYILIGNGENIGKKYDFMVNFPVNSDLAVDEEFDCSTNEKNDTPSNSCLNSQTNNAPLPMYVDDGGVNPDDNLPATPDPVVFDQTVNDVMVPHTATLCSEKLIDISKIPQITDDGAWNSVVNNDAYSDKPIINKKVKKEDHAVWMPYYTISELFCQIIKLKSGIATDPEFRKLVYNAREAQRSEISKKKIERMKAEGKKQYSDEKINDVFENNEEPGFKGFDDGDLGFNFNDNFEDLEQPVEEDNADAFEAYQKNAIDMQKHEQNQLEIMNEQLEMRKRVQNWHDNLRPILEAEENRTEFDVHEYGTRVLDCFKEIGEQKLFKELVGGLEHEEVSRYFLSTLMMTNTSNVKIINSQGTDDMKIELLNKERHHEQLQVNIGNQINQDSK